MTRQYVMEEYQNNLSQNLWMFNSRHVMVIEYTVCLSAVQMINGQIIAKTFVEKIAILVFSRKFLNPD